MNGENRNRKRPTNLNSSLEIKAKHRKQNMSSNRADIQDLSGTIISRPRQNQNLVSVVPNDEAITGLGPSASGVNVDIAPEIREVVVEETLSVQRALDERVKEMVRLEMNDVRQSIGELTRAVKELSVSSSRAQESVNSRQYAQNTHDRWYGNNDSTVDNRLTFQNRPVESSIGFSRTSRAEDNIHPVDNNLTSYGLGAAVVDPVVENRRSPGSHSRSESRNRNEKISIHVDKWGIIFNGNNNQMSVDDFIFRIEHLQAHYGISWEEILRDFHLLVTGPAKDWYWLLIRTRRGMRWPELKNELLNQYQANVSNFEIIRDLVERKQQPNESLDSFFHIMLKLRSRLVQGISEYDMIKILKRNVKESVAKIVYPISVSSVEQLRIECLEAERNFPRREVRNLGLPPRAVRAVNEVVYEDLDDGQITNDEVAALVVNQHKQQLVCWNCQVQGHGFRDCNSAERKLFCFRCGKPDTIAPKCPNCRQENRKRDVGLTGNLRPSKIPRENN